MSIQQLQRLTVSADDVVFIRVDPYTLPDQAQGLLNQLNSEMPDTKFVVLAVEDIKAIPKADRQQILSELGLD